MTTDLTQDLLSTTAGGKFSTILADPPWRLTNRTGKVAPEHRRLSRYDTMTLSDINALLVMDIVTEPSHPYLWVPNAFLLEGLEVMEAWGFTYKTNIVWHKIRKDGEARWSGGKFLFSEHHRASAIRRPRQ